MDEVEIEVVQAKSLERLVKALFCLAVVRVPEFRSDEDILTLPICQEQKFFSRICSVPVFDSP